MRESVKLYRCPKHEVTLYTAMQCAANGGRCPKCGGNLVEVDTENK